MRDDGRKIVRAVGVRERWRERKKSFINREERLSAKRIGRERVGRRSGKEDGRRTGRKKSSIFAGK